MSTGRQWWEEYCWRHGFNPRAVTQFGIAFRGVVADGTLRDQNVSAEARLAAIEVLLDTIPWPAESKRRKRLSELSAAVADRDRISWRLEGGRFMDVTSELVHREVVQPALLLLSGAQFSDVDSLFRKAYERLMGADPSGAITVATSAVEEMLRLGGARGNSLGDLAGSARSIGWIGQERHSRFRDSTRGAMMPMRTRQALTTQNWRDS